MINVVYIGDPVAAAGWRLAGVQTCTPADVSELRAVLARQPVQSIDLVLIDAPCARWLSASEAHALQARLRPLCLLLPGKGAEQPELQMRVRAQLGMSA